MDIFYTYILIILVLLCVRLEQAQKRYSNEPNMILVNPLIGTIIMSQL